MVNEINKIVADMLAREEAVHLPGIGSLVVEHRPAEMISPRRLRRACRVVEFTSRQQGRSLVGGIASAADIDVAQAQDAYERWLSKCYDGTVLAIGGVGRLDRKSFVAEEGFDRLLNPAGRGEQAVGRYGRHILGAAVSGIAIAVLAVAVGAGLYYTGFCEMTADLGRIFSPAERTAGTENAAGSVRSFDAALADSEPAAVETESPAEPSSAAADAANSGVRPVEADAESSSAARADAGPAGVAPGPSADAVHAPGAESVGRLASGCSYVVLGVFSTPENALRAMAEAREKGGADGGGAFVYGSKYMAAIYFDTDRARCAEYIRSAGQFRDLWIYTAR